MNDRFMGDVNPSEITDNYIEDDGMVTLGEIDNTKDEAHHLLDLSHPVIPNVLSAQAFQERVAEVFEKVSNILAKSYGPFGFASIISNYPFHHMTKDGFSIMKYVSMSRKYNTIDDSIKSLIEKPCGRLNFSVGDGTTTAVIATNSIYQSYVNMKDSIDMFQLPPRDILKAFKDITERVKAKLDDYIQPINTLPTEEMIEKIGQVANISSNGDEVITGMMKELYRELNYPLINVIKAPDGVTKTRIIDGYHYDLILMDEIYINNDDKTATFKNVDVLLFDHKVGIETFKKIIFPLAELCRSVDRKLIIVAPVYDEVAMISVKKHLITEFKKTGDNQLILTIAHITGPHNRAMYEDLSMLLDTSIITYGMEADMLENLDENGIITMIDVNNRNIPGLQVFKRVKEATENDPGIQLIIDDGSGKYESAFDLHEEGIRCGFAGRVNLAMKDGSTFNDLVYNKDLYEKTIASVEEILKEANMKAEKINGPNIFAQDVQKRLFNLKMKVGIIEVGGDSSLSQEMLKDSVVDTVKATESAFLHGVLNGCSIDTIRAIGATMEEVFAEEQGYTLHTTLLTIMADGFMNVYRTLLESRNISFPDIYNHDISLILRKGEDLNVEGVEESVATLYDMFGIKEGEVEKYGIVEKIFERKKGKNASFSDLCEFFILTSVDSVGLPLDITTNTFSTNVINSSKTDKEVLNTTMDLISLLITGNQLIVMDTM